MDLSQSEESFYDTDIDNCDSDNYESDIDDEFIHSTDSNHIIQTRSQVLMKVTAGSSSSFINENHDSSTIYDTEGISNDLDGESNGTPAETPPVKKRKILSLHERGLWEKIIFLA